MTLNFIEYSGAIGARLSSDASTIRNLVGDALATIVQSISTVVVGMAIALIANWILALIMLAIMPLLALQGIIQIKLLEESNAEAKVVYSSINLPFSQLHFEFKLIHYKRKQVLRY